MIDNTRKMNDVCLQHLQILKKLNVTFPPLHTVGNKVNKYVGNTGLVKKGKEKQALIRFDSRKEISLDLVVIELNIGVFTGREYVKSVTKANEAVHHL